MQDVRVRGEVMCRMWGRGHLQHQGTVSVEDIHPQSASGLMRYIKCDYKYIYLFFSPQVRYRMLMAEYKLENTKRAEIVMALMEEMEKEGHDFPFSYYVNAAKDYKTLEEAKEKFIKTCPICGDSYPIHEVCGCGCCVLDNLSMVGPGGAWLAPHYPTALDPLLRW